MSLQAYIDDKLSTQQRYQFRTGLAQLGASVQHEDAAAFDTAILSSVHELLYKQTIQTPRGDNEWRRRHQRRSR